MTQFSKLSLRMVMFKVGRIVYGHAVTAFILILFALNVIGLSESVNQSLIFIAFFQIFRDFEHVRRRSLWETFCFFLNFFEQDWTLFLEYFSYFRIIPTHDMINQKIPILSARAIDLQVFAIVPANLHFLQKLHEFFVLIEHIDTQSVLFLLINLE